MRLVLLGLLVLGFGRSAFAEQPRVLITGGASGIGRALALELGKKGWRVAMTDIRKDDLMKAAQEVNQAGGKPLALPGDVRKREDVRRQYGVVKKAWGGVDWLILNAGIGDLGSARDMDPEVYERVMDTNYGGAVNWMAAVLPDMKASKSGVIVGISSLSQVRGAPGFGAYSASKAALTNMLEGARIDLTGTGVDVVIVHPGWVRTAMTAQIPSGDMPFLLDAEDAARRIVRGVEARKRRVDFPWPSAFLMNYVLAPMPDALYDRLSRRLFKL